MFNSIVDKIRFYGPIGFCRLVIDVLKTKLLYRPARLVRSPIYIRSRGKITWGKNFTTGVALRIDKLDKSSELLIGDDVQINDYCHIGVLKSIQIGCNTIIGSKVLITDHSHGRIFSKCALSAPNTNPIDRPLDPAEVLIGSNCWIGEGVNILPGTKIGNGCIVSAGSVVSGTFPNNTLIKGNPARVIASYSFNDQQWELC